MAPGAHAPEAPLSRRLGAEFLGAGLLTAVITGAATVLATGQALRLQVLDPVGRTWPSTRPVP